VDILDIDPQALIILVIMIIGGLKWAMERMKGAREDEEGETPTTFEDLYEEARRKIHERQNREYPPAGEVHEEYEQPTIFEPAPAPPPVPAGPPPLPPGREERPAYDYSAPPPPVRATLSAAEQKALERIQAEGLTGRSRSRSRGRSRQRSGRSQVHRLLASPGAARSAIVLREILGPPKGAR